MRRIAIIIVISTLVACPDPPEELYQPPVTTETCDVYGEDCLQCCDPGYQCQRGRCIDGSLDLDYDGYSGHWDCDDYERDTYPGAPELCDDRDNNCDGFIDEGVRNDLGECAPPCVDLDLDGVTTCDNDCDDDDATVFPDAEEICDGRDNNCNDLSDEGFDEDGDGIGACGDEGDCDDTDPMRAPGFIEVCDGLDNDCNALADDGELCGLLGACEFGECAWAFDVASDDVEHETGAPDGIGGWCAGPGHETNVILVSGPARGMRDMPYGVYEAYIRLKVDDNSTSWSDCGPVARLRVNDRDADGTGTCRDCYFGGDVALVPRHFEASNRYETRTVPFSIGPEREDHLIDVVVVRDRCQDVTVCVDSLTIGERN